MLPSRTHDYLAHPSLSGLWEKARARLEGNDAQAKGRISIHLGTVGAVQLGGLLSRPVREGRVQVDLEELDTALRGSAAALGLASVLEALDGRPLVNRAAVRREEAARWSEVRQHRDARLAAVGLIDASWVPAWVEGMQRGLLARAGVQRASLALTQAIAALSMLSRTTAPYLAGAPPADVAKTFEIAALAGLVTGDAHALDHPGLASTLVLSAAAAALGRPLPATAADRRALWRELGVATDAVSGTVLVWALRPPGDDRWSAMLRERADLGLVTHLTLHELERAGASTFAPPGQPVSACENPQVLQAAAQTGVDRPLICLSGNPAVVGVRVLSALLGAGNPVRYHGDFDWPGVAIAGRVLALGALPWRMGAADYLAAVTALDVGLPLTGAPGPTPWEPALAGEMARVGTAVHEESLLPYLLSDLTT